MDDAQIGRPEPLSVDHDCADFDSGEPALDNWLRRRAFDNEARGASRTYVVCAGGRVVGYYALSAGAVTHSVATGRVKRNMPDPVPVMVLGRLAVDKSFHGVGIGTGLLRDAVVRILQAAEIAGIRAILVHAISEDAKRFYEKHGFVASSMDTMTLMVKLTEAAAIFDEKR